MTYTRPAFPGARWGMLPICGQCRRAVQPTSYLPATDWLHRDSALQRSAPPVWVFTMQCSPGTYQFIRLWVTLRWVGYMDARWYP